MQKLILTVLACVTLVLCHPQDQSQNQKHTGSLDDLINQIFSSDNSGIGINIPSPEQFLPNNPPQQGQHGGQTSYGQQLTPILTQDGQPTYGQPQQQPTPILTEDNQSTYGQPQQQPTLTQGGQSTYGQPQQSQDGQSNYGQPQQQPTPILTQGGQSTYGQSQQQPTPTLSQGSQSTFGQSQQKPTPNLSQASQSTPASPNPCLIGDCVPYYQCANGSIITDGAGLLDIRLGQEDNTNNEKHPCPHLFDTCCSLVSPTVIVPPDTKVNVGCGIRNPEGVGFRITGAQDNEAQFGEFPWTVAILKEEKALDGQTLNVYVCGGSLIGAGVVLTAAHCLNQKEPQILKIRAGEWDTQTRDEIFPHQDRQVRDFVIHPEYYRGGLFNDVALLFLTEPVVIAENVNTVCLPTQGEIFDGSRCFASGWGKDLFGKEGKYQVILKRVEVPIVPRVPCSDKLRETRLGKHFNLHHSFICAGGERGKDTCKGDGGSPLVCPIKNSPGRYTQAGIVAWGIGCGDEMPGVYVNVPLFRDWIDEQMQAHQHSTSAYKL